MNRSRLKASVGISKGYLLNREPAQQETLLLVASAHGHAAHTNRMCCCMLDHHVDTSGRLHSSSCHAQRLGREEAAVTKKGSGTSTRCMQAAAKGQTQQARGGELSLQIPSRKPGQRSHMHVGCHVPQSVQRRSLGLSALQGPPKCTHSVSLDPSLLA